MAKTSERWQEYIAGGTGATGGTVLLAIIRTLPDTTPGKTWMILAAPSCGVGASLIGRHFGRWLDARLRERRINRKFREAIEYQQALLRESGRSRAEKAQARAELNRLEIRRTAYMSRRLDEEDVPDS